MAGTLVSASRAGGHVAAPPRTRSARRDRPGARDAFGYHGRPIEVGTSGRPSRTSPVPVLHLLRRGAALPGVAAARLVRLRDLRGPVGRGRGQRGVPGPVEPRRRPSRPARRDRSRRDPHRRLRPRRHAASTPTRPWPPRSSPTACPASRRHLRPRAGRRVRPARHRRSTTTSALYDDGLGPSRSPAWSRCWRRLDRWAVCSNKHPEVGHAELARLGWRPTWRCSATPSTAPSGCSRCSTRSALGADEVVFVGDTAHDRRVRGRGRRRVRPRRLEPPGPSRAGRRGAAPPRRRAGPARLTSRCRGSVALGPLDQLALVERPGPAR